MSVGKRVIVGIVTMIWATGCLMTALYPGPVISESKGLIGIGILCLLIAVLCYFPQGQAFASRMMGTAIFSASVSYGFASLGKSDLGRVISGVLLVGLSCGYLAIKQEYSARGINRRSPLRLFL